MYTILLNLISYFVNSIPYFTLLECQLFSGPHSYAHYSYVEDFFFFFEKDTLNCARLQSKSSKEQ
jgi:hypothetical protein